MILGVVVSGITVVIGMVALMASGYQLTYFAKEADKKSTQPAAAQTDTAMASEAPTGGTCADQTTNKAPFDAEWLMTRSRSNERARFSLRLSGKRVGSLCYYLSLRSGDGRIGNSCGANEKRCAFMKRWRSWM